MTCSKKIRPAPGRSSIWVTRTRSADRQLISHPAVSSSGVNGLGRMASHLRSSASMRSGPRLSQIAYNAGTSSQEEKPSAHPPGR